jgi:nucleotide-binding universal stress UspA family protein
VLHVSQNALNLVGPEPFGVDFVKMQADIDEAARIKLHRLVSEQDRTDLRAVTVVRNTSAPAYEIIAYARDANIDLMVLGTHGRRAMAHLLVGSVAEKVVRLAPCPVLTVHHPEHEFVLPEALQIVTPGRPA